MRGNTEARQRKNTNDNCHMPRRGKGKQQTTAVPSGVYHSLPISSELRGGGRLKSWPWWKTMLGFDRKSNAVRLRIYVRSASVPFQHINNLKPSQRPQWVPLRPRKRTRVQGWRAWRTWCPLRGTSGPCAKLKTAHHLRGGGKNAFTENRTRI